MSEDEVPAETAEQPDEHDEHETTEKPYLTYQQVVDEQSEQAGDYHRITTRLSLFSTVFNLAFLGVLVVLRLPNWLRDLSPFGSGYSFLSVLWVLVLFVLLDFVIGLPLSYYRELIERRFGFATRSTGAWLKDKLKEIGIGLVLYVVLVEGLYSALHFQPDIWWIYAFLGYFIFAGVLSSLSPWLISIFTKVESMEPGEVRESVEQIAQEMGLEYDDIYTWTMSEQTTKANAAVTGFGKTIRIMIGDTLAENFRTDEISIVMCHEIAHQQNKDVYRGILFNGFISLFAFFLVDLGFDAAVAAFDFSGKSDPASIGYFFLAFSLAMELLGKISLWFSRTREKAADMVAIDHMQDLELFESAFARLSQQNLAFPNPTKLEVWWSYSHPPIRDRIAYAQQYVDNH